MQYRRLGKWGVKVSAVGLGSYLTIGLHTPDDEARAQVRAALDAGINFIDTANAYNRGGAESALGRILKEVPRHSIVLATKVFSPMGDGPNDRGLSRKHIFEQCHASLQRLQTDYVDLYQCHRPDPSVPVEETVRAMNDLIRQGKVLYWGVSEWSGAQIAEANRIAGRLGCHPIASNQPRYSLLWRHPEREVYPISQAEGVGQVTFSPLAHGVLSGKYKPGQPPPGGTRAADPTQNAIMMDLYFKDDILERVQRLAKLAGELGATASQLALAWILTNPAISSIILGITKMSQLEDNLKAVELKIPEEALAEIDRLFPLPRVKPAAP